VVDDYLPLNAAVATTDVFTGRYELDLMFLAAGLRNSGAASGALAKEGEAGRLRDAELPTTTFGTAEEQLSRLVQDRRLSVENASRWPIFAAASAT